MAKSAKKSSAKRLIPKKIHLTTPKKLRTLLSRLMEALLYGQIDRKTYYALLHGVREAREIFALELQQEEPQSPPVFNINLNVPDGNGESKNSKR